MMSMPEPKDGPVEPSREALRERLSREFHITALFVPAKTVAAVLGLSPSTIHAYIRGDAFFLPYRLINKTPMVAVDDLVDWCLSPDGMFPPAAKEPSSLWAAGSAEALDSDTARRMSASATEADRVVDETLKQLGLPPRRPRRRAQ